MPRKPRPIMESWQHALDGQPLVDAFLDCCSAAVALKLVPSPALEQLTFTLGFEELSGDIEEIRRILRPGDVAGLQAAAFRLTSASERSASERSALEWRTPPSVTLSVSPVRHTVSVNVLHAVDTAVALDLVATLRTKFPRLEQAAAEVAVRDGAGSTQVAAAPAHLQPGLRVDHYRLIRRLGVGYSGEVWQVEVVSVPPGVAIVPGQVVAMKQYFPTVLTRSSDSLRIQREFRVASELRHENLVSVYDLVLSPSRTFGSFLVMEYVAGQSLKSLIPEHGFDWQQCVQVGRQLCGALVELHSYGALHRDIKPANIIVLPGEQLSIKLLDLGIVSLLEEHGLTEASVFLGSKHTSAPEQLFGDEIDQRADVYALGATLYQCYRGKPLYDEEGPVTAVVRTMLENPRSCEAKPGATAEERRFVSIVARCLALDPTQRISSASDCEALLAELGA